MALHFQLLCSCWMEGHNVALTRMGGREHWCRWNKLSSHIPKQIQSHVAVSNRKPVLNKSNCDLSKTKFDHSGKNSWRCPLLPLPQAATRPLSGDSTSQVDAPAMWQPNNSDAPAMWQPNNSEHMKHSQQYGIPVEKHMPICQYYAMLQKHLRTLYTQF